MTTHELGKALTQARTARGLTLTDVERDTRISSKYIQALEDGQLETLPAPVYARAFMRTYAQYLGLNARELVQQMPGSRPEPELPPLPDVAREVGAPLISPSWVVACVIIVALVGVGIVLFWNRGGNSGGETVRSQPQPTAQLVGQGAEQPQTPVGQGPSTVVVLPGSLPNLQGENVLVAISALGNAGLKFFVIEMKGDSSQKQTVIQQSPSPGTAVSKGDTVTLVVGR
jgi:transcriptional regulator with XRE-family HTH domain